MCIGSDSHFLRPDDRYVHKAYLNSKGGEREVDAFYEYAHLMTEEEAKDNLRKSFEDTIIDKIFSNSEEIKNKITFYSLERPQSIPQVNVTNYNKMFAPRNWIGKYPTLIYLYTSDNIQERYWINECVKSLKEKNLYDKPEYLERLEEEARVKKVIGEKLGTCMFAYPNTLKHYIDLFWECGSTVGAGRGSAGAGLNHYLLGITQVDPLKWGFPFWRYMNDERIELADIDLDLSPSKIQKIFQEIRKERGELGIIQVCTFGSETAKSAILTACRGYRSEKYPNGIDVEEAQYLSSLVPVERGFLWSIEDMIYGNQEKSRKPVTNFINAVEEYPDLLDIIINIQGLVNKRSSHASGVILFDEDKIYETSALMRTPTGALITQWDLKNQEAAGETKYDFLLTSVQDIIRQTIELLQNNGIIEKELSLRQVYDKYFNPSIIDLNYQPAWEALAENKVIGCFQFDSSVGIQAAKKIKPNSITEMSNANGLMRLMTAEKGEESPLDKYVRFKNNINLWYQEMDSFGLTKEEQKTIEPYFLPGYGLMPDQESMMKILQDPLICGFSLTEANKARKIVGKKQMDKIPELHDEIISNSKSPKLGEYIWHYGIGPQMGYSFSSIHSTLYSMVGYQTLYLATKFPAIYWNTAYLIVNSGSAEENLNEQTDYKKIAKAIGEIQSKGIKVYPPDINKSLYTFTPDEKNDRIMYGLKGITRVGEDVIQKILELRPFSSLEDFYEKVKPNKLAMVNLIKGGAFDSLIDRNEAMKKFIWMTCDAKKRITLQNLPMLLKLNLIPQDTEEMRYGVRIYNFNRYLKANCKISETLYQLDERSINFLDELNYLDKLLGIDNTISIKEWEKIYKKEMDIFRNYFKEHGEEILNTLNKAIFENDWAKYATGNISSWEMDSLCFYYHEHELAHVNTRKYGLSEYFDLPEEPIVEKIFQKGEHIIPIYRLNKIYGTCIAKDDAKSTIYLLTNKGVAPVKFRKEYYALFNRQLFEKKPDGTKIITDRSWFTRGMKLVIQGIRRGDMFIPKKYASTTSEQIYLIEDVKENGDLLLRHNRKGEAEEDE